MAKCKICGEPHRACGGPTTVTPVDIRVTSSKGEIVTDLKLYNVESVGRRGAVPTVLKLSAEDAKARGLTDKDLFSKAKAAKPTTSSTTPKAPAKPRAPKGRKPAANKQAAPAANKADAGAPAPASTPAPAAE